MVWWRCVRLRVGLELEEGQSLELKLKWGWEGLQKEFCSLVCLNCGLESGAESQPMSRTESA